MRMKAIQDKYDLLVYNYRNLEKDTSSIGILAKREILNQVIPLLKAFKTNPGKIRNGKRMLKLFDEFKANQNKMKLLEQTELNPVYIRYHLFLKDRELKLLRKIQQLTDEKRLVFPDIQGKVLIDTLCVCKIADKQLDKFIDKMGFQASVYIIEISRILMLFCRLKLSLDILDCIENADNAKLEIDAYEKRLEEIYDYEALITQLHSFNRKQRLVKLLKNDAFEKQRISLFDEFNNDLGKLIRECRIMIGSLDESKSEKTDFNIRAELRSLYISTEYLAR
jgi:hypothetical protein